MNKALPKLSIIMGIYNCEQYLSDSIESIISQTYKNWELIMCDDGSTDSTLEIALEYKNKIPDKIVVIKNKKNMGLNYTLNKCIKYSTGDYIARQDGDDISLPDRFEKEMQFLLKNSEYSLVSANMIFFDENGDWGRSHNSGLIKKENFVKGSPICHAPCIIKRDALKKVGGYSVDDKLLRVEDYHLWFKLYLNNYKMYHLEECLYKMRDDSNAYKRRNFKNRINETRLKIWGLKKIGIPFYKRIWAFKPLALAFTPKFIYNRFHKKNVKMNNKIKVAEFVGSMNCGGTETMLINLLRSIDKEKYEVVFVENIKEKTYYTDEIESLGGRIIKISSINDIGMFNYIKNLIRLFKQENFDVVHSHVFLHSGFVMYSAKIAKIPIRISHSHSAMMRGENSFIKEYLLRKFILRYSTEIVACSTEAGISLFGNKFLKTGKLLPNPINLSKIKEITDNDIIKLRKKYNISKGTYIIGHVGRLVEIKNHKFLIDIAQKLSEQKFNYKMFFLGDGPLFEELKSYIKRIGLDKNIIMTGNVTNVYEFMRMFNILLLPSFYEGLPVTLIEAQASGLYSIVSDNVSKESDLGLNLIKFESISTINPWIKSIIHFRPNNIKKEKIYNKISSMKYSSDTSIIEYEKMYNSKGKVYG